MSEVEFFKRKQKLIILIMLYIHHQRKNRRKQRRYWVRPIIHERINQGDGHHLINEIRLFDPETHFAYCRMTVAKFDDLLQRVQPLIEKQITNFRHPISARDRLYLTLR